MTNARFLFLLLTITAAIVLLTITLVTKENSEKKQLVRLESHLIQVINELKITLERHSYLPSLLARDNEIKHFLNVMKEQDSYEGLQTKVNLSLEFNNDISGTNKLFLLNSNGQVVAASNWADSESYIGSNFSDRPYFKKARRNILGRHFNLPKNAEEQYYYFASSVVDKKNQVLGIIVVEVSLSDIVSHWIVADTDFFISDKNGNVFLNTENQWKFDDIENLLSEPIKKQLTSDSKSQKVNLADENYLMLTQRLESAEWHVSVLSNLSLINKDVFRAFWISALIMSLLSALAILIYKIQKQRKEFQRRVTTELENKVKERTKALKQSQEDLIQAAKMAALGQLSAGITHEINNPLTAIRSYADNASQFIEKERFDMVQGNLKEISQLTEQMATITGQLKSFARKSKGQLQAVNLDVVLESALSIVRPKIISTGTKLNISNDKGSKIVMADELWLSQVLVNLIYNAISATNMNEERIVWVNVSERIMKNNAHYCVEVRDNGSGIDESNLSRIFEPFFTTKPTSKGLGLGLSISFNLVKDMNGSLEAKNYKDGGALFTLCLPVHE